MLAGNKKNDHEYYDYTMKKDGHLRDHCTHLTERCTMETPAIAFSDMIFDRSGLLAVMTGK